jgi:hypothetical protein
MSVVRAQQGNPGSKRDMNASGACIRKSHTVVHEERNLSDVLWRGGEMKRAKVEKRMRRQLCP